MAQRYFVLRFHWTFGKIHMAGFYLGLRISGKGSVVIKPYKVLEFWMNAQWISMSSFPVNFVIKWSDFRSVSFILDIFTVFGVLYNT